LLEAVEGKEQRSLTTSQEVAGRKALHSWWKKYLGANSTWYEIVAHLDTITKESLAAQTVPADALWALPPSYRGIASKAALELWESLYRAQEYQLDSLFRVLYRRLLWIDSQGTGSLNDAQKWLYVSIVRSQLSWVEMVYLFYNGYTGRGAKFKGLAEKYALFDNLTFSSDPVITILRECPPGGKGYSPTAYDSILARKSLGLPEKADEAMDLAASGVISSESASTH
jgi:hypothetical protein